MNKRHLLLMSVMSIILVICMCFAACDPYEEPVLGTKLDAPVVSIDANGLASWTAVENASGYKYTINGGSAYSTNALSVQLYAGQTIKVKAVGDGKNYLDSDYSQPSSYTPSVKTQLDAPVVSIDANGLASWSAVANASGYAYKLNNGAETAINGLSLQLSDGDTLIVKAVGDNIDYTDSAFSSPKTYTAPVVSNPITLDAPVINIDESGHASWSAMANASAYAYKLNNGETVTIHTTSLQLNDGDTLVVKALGDGENYLDSDWSTPATYTAPVVVEPSTLDAPVVSVDANGLATWAAVENASGYAYKLNNGEAVSTNALSLQLNDGDTLVVKALGDGENYLDSAWSTPATYTAPAVDPATLDTPVVSVDANGLASWAAVENASCYAYKLNNGDVATTNALSIQLSDGDTIVVKALGDGENYLDSDWSNTHTYTATIVNPTALDAPVVSVDANGLATWAAVENASGYVYKLNDGDIDSTVELSVQLADGDTIVVMALGNGTTHLDSAWSTPATYTVATCEHTTLKWESDNAQHWQVCADCGVQVGDKANHNWNDTTEKCDDCTKPAFSLALVKSVDDLKDGMTIIIVGVKDGEQFALSTTQTKNNRSAASFDGAFTDEIQLITLQKQDDSTWALYVGNGYLYAAGGSDNNYLKTENTLSIGKWTISFDGNAANIVGPSSVKRNVLKFNASSSLFSCYASGQSAVYIYTLSCNHHIETTVGAKDSTCKEAGSTGSTVCKNCGEVLASAQELPLADHTPETDAAVAPTCTEAGKTEGSHCSVCGVVLTAQEDVKATGHAWDDGVVSKDPTCTEKGEKKFTCSTCGATKTEDIDATGHAWVDWSKDNADDDYHYTSCPNCNDEDMAEHDWTEVNDGTTITKTCKDCGYVVTLSAHDHVYDGTQTANWADDHTSCTVTIACSVAGCTSAATYTSTSVDHVVKTDSTCHSVGTTTYTAHFDGLDDITADVDDIAKKGHTLVWVSTDDEYHWQVCSNDGCDFEDTDTMAAHSGTTSYNAETNMVSLTCSVCENTTEQHLVEYAYTLEKGENLTIGETSTFTLTGTITKITYNYNASNNSISAIIQVGDYADNAITCFKMKGGNGLAVGDTITVTGAIKNYNGTIEFDQNCTYLATVNISGEHATTSLTNGSSVATGTTLEFTVSAEEGWTVSGVSANGSTLTAVDGKYSVVVSGNMNIVVSTVDASAPAPTVVLSLDYSNNESGLNLNSSSYTNNNGTHQVSGADGTTYTITTNQIYINGDAYQWQKGKSSLTVTGSFCRIDITSSDGSYTIKLDGETFMENGSNQTGTFVIAESGTATGKVSKIEFYAYVTTCEHVWDDGVVTKEATCTETGVTTYSCTKCDATKTEEIEKAKHTYQFVTQVNPTCVNGVAEHYECEVCHSLFTKNDDVYAPVTSNALSIPATDSHSFVDGTCSVCGATQGQKTWQKLTSADTLQDGDQIVFVLEGTEMTSISNSKGTCTAFDGETPNGTFVFTVVANNDDSYSFKTEDGKYLCNTSSTSISLTTSGNINWKITFDDAGHVLVNNSSNTNRYLHGSSGAIKAYAQGNLGESGYVYIDIYVYR